MKTQKIPDFIFLIIKKCFLFHFNYNEKVKRIKKVLHTNYCIFILESIIFNFTIGITN